MNDWKPGDPDRRRYTKADEERQQTAWARGFFFACLLFAAFLIATKWF